MTIIVVKLGPTCCRIVLFIREIMTINHCSKTWPLPVVVVLMFIREIMTIIVVKLGLYLLSYSFVHQRNHDNHCSKTWPLPVVVQF